MSGTSDAIERNMDLSFDFARRIFENPEILEEIPEGATLVLLPDDDPSLLQEKMELGIRALHRGENVYFRHVKSPSPAP
jgi:hypothetical protein